MQVEIVTDLTSEPITVAEARAYLRITTTSEDSLISAMITSARERLEKFANLSFGAKTLKVYWEEIDGWKELPYQPKATITSVENSEGDALTYEERGLTYISVKANSTQGVIVEYEVEGIVNEAIKEAIKKEVATAYENRENFAFMSSHTLTNSAKYLVQPFSRNTFLGI